MRAGYASVFGQIPDSTLPPLIHDGINGDGIDDEVMVIMHSFSA